MSKPSIPIEIRLNKYKQIDDKTACYIWTGTTTRKGYGIIEYNDKPVLVHRLAYELYVGTLDSLLVLDHICENKLCFNTKHLQQISQKENIQLYYERDSTRRGLICIHGDLYIKEYKSGKKCMECNKIRNRLYEKDQRLLKLIRS